MVLLASVVQGNKQVSALNEGVCALLVKIFVKPFNNKKHSPDLAFSDKYIFSDS